MSAGRPTAGQKKSPVGGTGECDVERERRDQLTSVFKASTTGAVNRATITVYRAKDPRASLR